MASSILLVNLLVFCFMVSVCSRVSTPRARTLRTTQRPTARQTYHTTQRATIRRSYHTTQRATTRRSHHTTQRATIRRSYHTTQRATIRRSYYTTRKMTRSRSYTYGMDSPSYCNSNTLNINYFKGNVKAYVNAWTNLESRQPLGSCVYTFHSDDKLRFRFKNLQIRDCGVTLSIYRGLSTSSKPLYTYTCTSPSITTYQTVANDYIILKIDNNPRSTNYDFSFYVENYGYQKSASPSHTNTIQSVVAVVIIYIASKMM